MLDEGEIIMVVGTDGHQRATAKIVRVTGSYRVLECDGYGCAESGETVLLVSEGDSIGTGLSARIRLTAGKRLTIELDAKAIEEHKRPETRFHGTGSVATVATPSGIAKLTVMGVGLTGFEFKSETQLPNNKEMPVKLLVRGQYQTMRGTVTKLSLVGPDDFRGEFTLSFASRLDQRLWQTALECAGYFAA